MPPIITKQTTKPAKKVVKSDGVLDRIAPVSLDDTFIKMNLYGRSGSGKTTLACSAPKKVLIIGTEDGTKSVHNVKGVDFVQIRDTGELTELTRFLREDDHEYKTAVLDTASGLQDLALKEILGVDELPAQRSWGMAKQQEWGQCAFETKERLRALLSLKMHVIILAQERDFKSEDSSDVVAPYVASALSPSVVGWLNPAVDYICQTFIRQKMETKEVTLQGKKIKQTLPVKGQMEYCLRTFPDPTYTTKFRVPKGSPLPLVLVDPSFDKILKVIKGEGV